VAVGLAIDHSSSMRPKLTEVTAAARAFVRSSNREDQNVCGQFQRDRVAGTTLLHPVHR
jgi:hypothetical protein